MSQMKIFIDHLPSKTMIFSAKLIMHFQVQVKYSVKEGQ